MGKVVQLLINLLNQSVESRKVPQVRGLPFDAAPQVLNRIKLGRVLGQVIHRQAGRMLGKEFLHRRTRMIPRAILNQTLCEARCAKRLDNWPH